MGKSDFSVCISKQGPQFYEGTHSLSAKPLTLRGQETLWLQCGLAWATFKSVRTCSVWKLSHDSLCPAVPSPSQRAGGNDTGGLRIRKHSVYGKVPSWVSFPIHHGRLCRQSQGSPAGCHSASGPVQSRARRGEWVGQRAQYLPSGCRSARVLVACPWRSWVGLLQGSALVWAVLRKDSGRPRRPRHGECAAGCRDVRRGWFEPVETGCGGTGLTHPLTSASEDPSPLGRCSDLVPSGTQRGCPFPSRRGGTSAPQPLWATLPRGCGTSGRVVRGQL